MSENELPYVRKVLPNGLTILVYPMSQLESAGIILKIHTGEIYEEGERGLAHVTEHLLFMGSKNYPSEKIVSEEMEMLGAVGNASTSSREMEMWLHLPKKNLEKGLKLMADCAFAATISEAATEKERGTVIQEWQGRHDQPNFRFYQKMYEARYGDPNHPYVRDESLKLLSSYKNEDIKTFYAKFFHPQQMILSVGGGVDAEETLKYIEKYFGEAGQTELISEPVFPTNTYASKQIITHEEKMSQANLSLSFPAYGTKQKDPGARLIDKMAVRILGGGIVSRLWRILREERGLVYGVGSHIYTMPYLGMIEISTSTTMEKLAEVIKLIKDEVDRFSVEGPTEKEMTLEKEYRLGRLATGFEGSMGTARYFADEEFEGEGIKLLTARMEMVERVTVEDVKAAAKGLFDWTRVHAGLMNDFQGMTKEGFEEMVGGLRI